MSMDHGPSVLIEEPNEKFESYRVHDGGSITLSGPGIDFMLEIKPPS